MTDVEIVERLLALIARQDAKLVAAAETNATEQLQTCPDCHATWHGHNDDTCQWCVIRRFVIRRPTDILTPPPPRQDKNGNPKGYGHATRGDHCPRHDRWWTHDNPAERCCDGPFEPFDDFQSLGYDPDRDRQRDLEHWRQDMQTAADAGYITETEGTRAWRSATNHQNSSTSSTGTNSTPTKTTKTTRSFPDSHTAAAGQRSTPARKPGNRRSS